MRSAVVQEIADRVEPPESGVRLVSTRAERVRALVEDHADLVSRALVSLGVPMSIVDDCAQRVFIIATSKMDLIEEGRETAFLFSTARRVAANTHRSLKLRRQRETLDEVALSFAQDGRLDPERALVDREGRALLEQVLGAMSRELRDV